MLNISKNELEKLLLIEKRSYESVGKIYNVSGTAIKKYALKLQINLPKRSNFPKNWSPHNKLNKTCKFCKTEIIGIRTFCSKNCFFICQNQETYRKYLENIKLDVDVCKYTSTNKIKTFILKEQNYCCAICNHNSIWNNKPMILILDHIDGDATNNKRTNLRCVCHNCDSQLSTYKAKNKNSKRINRYKK